MHRSFRRLDRLAVFWGHWDFWCEKIHRITVNSALQDFWSLRISLLAKRFLRLWPCQSPSNAKDTQRPGDPLSEKEPIRERFAEFSSHP